MCYTGVRPRLTRPPEPFGLGQASYQGMKAIWKGTVIAESNDTVVVEGNHYFPAVAVKAGHVRPSVTTTTCGWKGLASYYTVTVDGHDNPDAAWYYAAPKPEAKSIAGRVAFWKGVSIQP